jgi:hypothetical protein
MKRNATATIFLALSAIYLLNASITIASLRSSPRPQHLQPTAPTRRESQDRLLQTRIESSAAALEIPVYTRESAVQAIRPAPWTCGDPNDSALDPLTQQKPMFAFVHIYKTAGSTIRNFFQTYAYICRKGWMCLQRCTDVKSSSIQSDRNWKKCQVEHALDRKHKLEKIGVKRKLYPKVNNTVLRDKFDLFGGHTRLGAGDNVLKTNDDGIHPIRHIVFLRDPMDRYVSGVLYQLQKKKKGWTSVEFAKLVKERVLNSRGADEYWDRSLSYLLTPSQTEDFQSIKSGFLKANTAEQFVEVKAKTAINNLMKYNVIIGMTERMKESMEILKHVLMSGASQVQEEQLDREATNKSLNVSKKGQVSTSSVLDELKEDTEFMSVFHEYVKFEKLINDFAMTMHLMQYEQIELPVKSNKNPTV